MHIMSSFDIATLPAPLGEYFTAADHAATAHLFADDAEVHDEGEQHVGSAAITAWLASVEARYHPRYVVEAAHITGSTTEVSFTVSGTFPGSPARLRQTITTANNRITGLRTL